MDELDYGEGKTREQESRDSVAMLGAALLAAIAFAMGAALTFVLLTIIF